MEKNIQHIGLFGGTFDPIHNGHIYPLKQAASLLNLSNIRIMPAHIPPHKNRTYSDTIHRAAMTQLVCEQEPLFVYDDNELKRQATSYTVETLTNIQQAQSANSACSLYFFLGADSLINFTRWHRWQDILSLCHLVVMPRPGYALDNLPEALSKRCISITEPLSANKQTDNSCGNIYLMPKVLHDISSTDIRHKIQQQASISSLVPACVYRYLTEHQLYR